MHQPLDSQVGFIGVSNTSWIKRTISFCRITLHNLSLLLQVNIPALCSPLFVFQYKGKDRVALLDSVFPLGFIGLEGGINGIESGRGGEGRCRRIAKSAEHVEVEQGYKCT